MSVAHDFHNIMAVGISNETICKVVNLIVKNKGGIPVLYNDVYRIPTLPVVVIMSVEDRYKIAQQYSELNTLAKDVGSKLNSPFMMLSFMTLLVIPEIKLNDKGLFDGTKLELTSLFM